MEQSALTEQGLPVFEQTEATGDNEGEREGLLVGPLLGDREGLVVGSLLGD